MFKKFFISLFIALYSLSALADEGMWPVSLLSSQNIEAMRKLGFQLSAEDIYSLNNPSLKDAIVMLDGGSCTGEFVSGRGLVFTNHHCAFGDIHGLSTPENNILKDGFWAKSLDQEIPIPGKTASLLISVEDCTDEVKAEIEKQYTPGRDRTFMMRRILGDVEKKAREKTGLEASVASFYSGNKYMLFYYKTYSDLRLVGAPPESIGAFGGDTDNWMWPQHKGDFAIYRVYANENNEPAKHDQANVPYQPARFLEISASGLSESDFAMVMGYPYNTNRYNNSYGVTELLETTNPVLIKVRGDKLAIMHEAMKASEEVRLKYASKFFNASNYHKYAIGQNKYLERFNVIEKKRDWEGEFTQWVNANPERKKKYGDILALFEKNYGRIADYRKTETYYQEGVINGSDLLRFSLRGRGLNTVLEKGDEDTLMAKRLQDNLKAAEDHFKNFDFETDRKMFPMAIKNYYENVDPAYISDEFRALVERFAGDYEALADFAYKESIFASPERFKHFIENPSIEILHADPLYQISSSTLAIIIKLRLEHRPFQAEIRDARRLFLEALLEMNGSDQMYPDANSTMRLTYGTVGGYSPLDAIYYDYYTTSTGILEKEIPGDIEFSLKPDFKEVITTADHGQFSDKEGKLRINFVSDNDITGGNSGSPLLNAKGQLVGIAFDGNWESMAGDIYFHPEMNKSVSVDIRYVLFIIDKYANAQNIMQELVITK